MPTSVGRRWAGQGLGGLFGIGRGVLEGTGFPGLKMEAPAQLIL